MMNVESCCNGVNLDCEGGDSGGERLHSLVVNSLLRSEGGLLSAAQAGG